MRVPLGAECGGSLAGLGAGANWGAILPRPSNNSQRVRDERGIGILEHCFQIDGDILRRCQMIRFVPRGRSPVRASPMSIPAAEQNNQRRRRSDLGRDPIDETVHVVSPDEIEPRGLRLSQVLQLEHPRQ